jgi:predicted metalloprotease with PDZ domain
MTVRRLVILVLCGTLLLTACSRNKRTAAPAAAGPGWVGIECQARPGLSDGSAGLVVVGVDAGGPGQRAGVRPGDILLSFGQSKLGNADPAALTRLATETAPGAQVPAVLQRDGRTIHVRVVVASKPPVATPPAVSQPPAPAPRPLPPPPPPPKPVREQDIVFPK